MALVGGTSAHTERRTSAENTDVGDATFPGLPVELQKMILEYCSTNADKKNVCATSKRLQALMTPLLYQHMELRSARLSEGFLSTLTASRPGLSHVRTLRISDTYAYPTETQISVACRLIFALPRNALTRLELPTYYFSNLDIHYAVRLREMKVTNHQYCGVEAWNERRIDWKNLAPSPDELAHITSLQILMINTSDIERAAYLFDRTPALQNLDIRMDTAALNSDWTCCEAAFHVLEKFLASGAAARSPTRLKALRLTSMCLSQSSTLLPSLLDFEGLETLQLFQCGTIQPLLEHLTKLGLHLASICIDQDSSYLLDREDCAIMSAFIASLVAPKRLSIISDGVPPYDGQVEAESLQRCAQSIDYLRLEGSAPAKWLYDAQSNGVRPLLNFCEHATSLKQLYLSGIHLEDEFEVAELLDTIKPLPALNVLRLRMLLKCARDMSSMAGLVNLLAKKIFNMADSDLAAIFIQLSSPFSMIADHGNFAFLRSTLVDPDGKKIFVAVEIEPHMVKHHVACADILEEERFVLA